MAYKLTVENIKCGGCASTINSKLSALDVVDSVDIDIEDGVVNIGGEEAGRTEVAQLLLKLGYPETGTTEGLKAAKAKAKSFVSCAVGKINS